MSDILKQRDVLKKEWENNGSKSKTRFTYACKYSDVNELTFEWFKQARAKLPKNRGFLKTELL